MLALSLFFSRRKISYFVLEFSTHSFFFLCRSTFEKFLIKKQLTTHATKEQSSALWSNINISLKMEIKNPAQNSMWKEELYI
jgi:hypothetical protein